MTCNGNLVGIDGFSPVYDPEGLWRVWSIDDIWRGPSFSGQSRHVPKVKDYVRDPETYETWIVDALDPITLIPTLRAIKPSGMNHVLSDHDVIFGVGPGAEQETYRAYLNDQVFPHSLTIPGWLKVYGSLASYAKIFLGTDTTQDGEIISKVYDATGQFISQAVQLEDAMVDSHHTYSVKVVKPCYITKKLPDGERITLVIYRDDGHVYRRYQLLVENTDLISDVHAPDKYISEISLESIWLSNSDPALLEYKLNIPMNALNLIGVVHYSDGTTLRLPVDGSKFSMLGLEGRISSIPDQPHELVLRYMLSPGESAYASTGVNGRYITKPYRIVTRNQDKSIAVKLFGYPQWEGASFGYRMRWWLLNLSRNTWFEVTQHVQFAENTGPYDPKLYGYLQRKSVLINLSDVSPSFIPFIHTQVVDIVLNHAPNSDAQPAWLVATEASDFHPRYGNKIYGRIFGQSVNFSAGHGTQQEWLDAYYWQTRPLVDVESESSAPVPTHFIVTYNSFTVEREIHQWDQDMNLGTTPVPGSFASIRFIRRLPSGDIQLAVAGAMIKHIAI